MCTRMEKEAVWQSIRLTRRLYEQQSLIQHQRMIQRLKAPSRCQAKLSIADLLLISILTFPLTISKMVKRDPEDELSETGSEGDTDKTAVETARKKAKPSPSKSKSATPSPSKANQKASSFAPSSSQTARSKLGEMIIECGIKNLSKPEAQIRVSIWFGQRWLTR